MHRGAPEFQRPKLGPLRESEREERRKNEGEDEDEGEDKDEGEDEAEGAAEEVRRLQAAAVGGPSRGDPRVDPVGHGVARDRG